MTKYFRDPVHGAIAVDSKLLLALIDSRAVQRLKYVRQLGTAYFAYQGAEHSRFSHSLGAMHLMGRVLAHLCKHEGLRMSERARENAQAAALLHDIGHCAFSHTLEVALDHNHETMSARLILEEPELGKILGRRRKEIVAIFRNKGLVKDLVSSQLDVDRLDYLVRDSHHTGVKSSRPQLDRIISSFSVSGGKLVVKENGALSVEEYFLARYFMYWKVYFHKTTRGMELMLTALLRRARQLIKTGQLPLQGTTPALKAFLVEPQTLSTSDFLNHDDSDVLVAIKAWQYCDDTQLSDLCKNFLGRKKFHLLLEASDKSEELTRKQLAAIPGVIVDRFGDLPYDPRRPVMLLTARGKLVDLAKRSALIRSVNRRLVRARYYVPQKYAAQAKKVLRG